MIATRPPEESQDPATVSIHSMIQSHLHRQLFNIFNCVSTAASAHDVSLPTTPFELTWALAAVTSYTLQPRK